MSAPEVAQLRVHRVGVPLHTPFVTALRRTDRLESLAVELVDADGVSGFGEVPQAWRITGESLAGAAACLRGPLAEAVVGAPGDLDEATRRLAAAVVGNLGAVGAVDVALHDLAARRAGVPLAVHLAGLGGWHAPVTPLVVATDVTVAVGSPSVMAEAALARVGEGFAVLKLKVGTDPDLDVARVSAVRTAVGPGVVLRLDANQGWRADEALRVLDRLREADVELVEQPVPARDRAGLAHVRRHAGLPVVADESVFDLHDLVEVLRLDAADLVNVKLAKCGGLTAALELVRVARRHGVGVMVGSMMESHLGVGAAAALALAAGGDVATPSPLVDLDAAWWAVSSPWQGGPRYEGTQLSLPAVPGLGVAGPR